MNSRLLGYIEELFAPENSGSGAGTSGTSDEQDPPTSATEVEEDDEPQPPEPNANDSFERWMEQYGGPDPREAARSLWSDNFRKRRINRELRTENEELKRKLPGRGAVVVKSSEVAELRQYRQLGKPEELRTALSERETLRSQITQTQRNETLREVAEVSQYNARVLRDIGKDLDYEIKDVDEGGQKKRVAYVRTSQNGAIALTPLAEYAQSNWEHLMPALTANAASGGTSGGNGMGANANPRQGRKFVQQPTASSAPSGGQNDKGVSESYIKSRYPGPKPGK